MYQPSRAVTVLSYTVNTKQYLTLIVYCVLEYLNQYHTIRFQVTDAVTADYSGHEQRTRIWAM